MKFEKQMDCIGQTDGSIIEEADVQPTKAEPVRWPWIKLVSVVVAATCLIIAIPFLLNRAQPTSPIDLSGLPKLAVDTGFGDFGFEGYLAYDVRELRNGNPWTDKNSLATMPVFTNHNEYDRAGAPINGLSPEEMLAEAEKIADLFSLEITSLYTEPTLEQIAQIIQKLEAVDASEEE